MIWTYDQALHVYRLTCGACSARVWQLVSGRWGGETVDGQNRFAKTFDTQTLAQLWCEEYIEQLRLNGHCEDTPA
jgi:hypothetical protein